MTEQQVRVEARRWIKALRHLSVDGVPLRDRFTYRGDSLWWFAELYLHKQGTIDRLWRTAMALDALGPRERERAARELITPHRRTSESRLALDLRSRFYTWSALASRVRVRPHRAAGAAAAGTLAFVHSAFWRKPAGAAADPGSDADEGQEGYIGAVLQALQARAAAQPVRLVGVGPRTNFKARRWWHALAPSRVGVGEIPVEPIERFASWRALAGSRAIWRERFAMERALLASDAIRAHATILGYDLWPIIANELRGIARLQFPWSARAMDEAAAAMEIVRPALVVTYAEAGGWGRALILEARRRGIPSVGLQHGFIYGHWLNYLHEPDEMHPSPTNPADPGFPRPDRTLVYDAYAAHHLVESGHFPPEAVTITGSPALDALVTTVTRIDEAERARIRQVLESPRDHLIVLVTKYTQVREALPGLLRAVAGLDHVRLVIKPHPAETAEAYRVAAGTAGVGVGGVVIAPASLDLARLLSVARLLVTVNSTVAIDAIALGVPAVIVGLPNNLSPFVDAGVMAGGAESDLPDVLAGLIQDEARREAQLVRARGFAAEWAMRPDGRAAERAADAMIGLLGPPPGRPV